MFGGDDDDNPFANAISPFGSSSVYTPSASFSPTQPTFGSSSPPRQLTDPFAPPPPSLSQSSFQATPRDEYGFADEHPYGAPLDAPILSPKEDRPSPYVAAIEKVQREEDEHNDQDEGGSGFGSTSFNNNNISSYHTQHQDAPSSPTTTSGFGGGGGGMEGFEAASSSTFGVPSYSQPPIVDLHAVEEELVVSQQPPLGGKRTSAGGFNPLLGLLGETEEEKMKSAFKPSVRTTPVKKKVVVVVVAPTKKKDTTTTTKKEEIKPLVLDKKEEKEEIIAPEPVAAPPSSKKEDELDVDVVPTPPPRPTTPPPPPAALEDSTTPTPLASPQPQQLPIINLETPSSPPQPSHSPHSPSSTPLPVSTPSSPPPPPPAPHPVDGSTPSSPTPNHSSTPSLFTESTSSDTLPPTPHVGRVVVSPLETPTQEFDRSFASLALGGSSSGGWGGEEQDTQTIVSSSMIGGGSSSGWGGDAGGGWGAVGPEASSLGEQQQEVDDEEEEEDNRPLQARVDRARSNSPPPPPTQAMAIEGEKAANKMFEIHVGDPTKVGLAATAHIVYTVTTRTTSQSAFSRQDVSVFRRFSDFLWLFTILQTNNPGVIVPPVPDKHPFGRFAEDFVETRRNALEQCLQKMANHPVLQLDPDLRLFLESDTLSMEMKNRKAEVASEQKGYLASLTSTLSGPKYYERDEWFDQKKLVLDTLESQLKILVKSIELVSKQRLDLAVATSDFAEAIASLAASDLSKQLSHALERLADIGRRSRDVHEDNAKGDVRTFMSTADEYIRLIASVRLAFSSRVKTYLSWQSLEAESRRLRTNLEKARKAGKVPQERVGMEIQIVAEAERRSKEAQAEYESVSRLVKNEFVRFETERVEDFKTALEKFLEGMIKRQKILIAAFEDYHRDLLKLVQQNPTGRQAPPSPLPPAQEEEASSVSETASSSFVNGGGGGGPPVDENAWA